MQIKYWIMILGFLSSSLIYADTSCSLTLLSDLKEREAGLHQVIIDLLEAHRNKDPQILQQRFHPRLGEQPAFVKATLIKQKNELVRPEYSVHQIWSIENATVDGINCPDGTMVYPHYGYTKQVFVSLQAQGSKELGRIFFSLVPEKNDWLMGYYHFRPITFLGQNAINWGSRASLAIKDKLFIQAYLFWSLAEKLVRKNPHFVYPEWELLEKNKPAVLNLEGVLNLLGSVSSEYRLIGLDSLLMDDKLGVALRWQSKDWKTPAEHKLICEQLGAKLRASPDFPSIKTMVCALNHESEDSKGDGRMGSLPLDF